jgi:hypothetical protein
MVEAAGGEEFLGAEDAEFLVEVLAELVLPAVAAREREVGGAVAAAEGEPGDELGVFVVGVRGDVEDGAEVVARLRQLLRRPGARRETEDGGISWGGAGPGGESKGAGADRALGI